MRSNEEMGTGKDRREKKEREWGEGGNGRGEEEDSRWTSRGDGTERKAEENGKGIRAKGTW